MSNPRKFSEKIALHAQKQAEGTAAFEAIMKEVSSTTKAALAKKIASKQLQQQSQQVQQLLNQQNSVPAYSDTQQQQNLLKQQELQHQLQQCKQPLPFGNSFVGNAGQHLLRQEPLTYKGRSLPNVNQMVTSNKAIDLQMALTSLENMQHEVMGRRASSSSSRCAEKMVNRVPKERSSSQPRKNYSIFRHRERSPYGSIYLSPPVDPSWRRVSSDSAIHHNVASDPSKCPSRIIINNASHHVNSSDNITVCFTGRHVSPQQQQSKNAAEDTANGRPRSCDVPGINIYPSEVAYDNNLAYALALQQHRLFINNNNSNNSSSLPSLCNDSNETASRPGKVCSILIQQDTLTEDNVASMATDAVAPMDLPPLHNKQTSDKGVLDNEQLYRIVVSNDANNNNNNNNDAQQLLLQYQQLVQQQQQLQREDCLQDLLLTPQLNIQQPLTGNFFPQQYSFKGQTGTSAMGCVGSLAGAADLQQQQQKASAVPGSEKVISENKANKVSGLDTTLFQQQATSHSLQQKFQRISMDAIQDDSNLQALLLLHSDASHHPTASSLDHPLLEAMSKQQHNKVLQNDIYSGIDCSKQDSLSDISITPDIFLTAEELAKYASKLAQEGTDIADSPLLLQQPDQQEAKEVVRGKLQREDNSLEECKDTLNILSYINDSNEDALQLDPLEVDELQMLADSTIFADPATEDSFRLDRP